MSFDGRDYQAHFDRLAAHGVDVHGEATFVRRFTSQSVLDAGCGTGRVAIELARHGIDVVGVDVDASMIAEARRRPNCRGCKPTSPTSPSIAASTWWCWRAMFRCSRGNPGRSYVPAPRIGGVLVASSNWVGAALADFDGRAGRRAALVERWSTWDREPFSEQNDYAVSVAGRPASETEGNDDSRRGIGDGSSGLAC
jgi:SAM-dependent methyltransferase